MNAAIGEYRLQEKAVQTGECGFGFCAHFDDYMGEGPLGIGYTKQEAIDSLLQQQDLIDDEDRAKWFDKPLEDIKERWTELGNRETLTILETEEWGALEGYIEHMTGRKA